MPTFNGAPILQDLSILSSHKANVPNSDSYIFDKGAKLEGYTFSQANNQIEMNFYWSSTSSTIEMDLSQIMHLIHENGDDYFIFDRHPFSGAFPTNAWIKGMLEVDNWQIDIPDDAAEGKYTLYTGLYYTELAQRIPVKEGNSINDLIPIAEITVPASD
jgi:hypothetical protein